MFSKRRTKENASSKNQADGLDMADWRSVIGRHSIMLALEPRFMFDGAGADVADPAADAGGGDADVPDGLGDSTDGGDETITVFNTGFGTFGAGDPEDPEELALAVGSSASSGVSLNEDGSKLIGDIEITGGEDTDYVKVVISLDNGGEFGTVDFNFKGGELGGESHIDRTLQHEGIISVWGTRDEVNKLLDTLTFKGGENAYTKGGGEDNPETMTVSLFSCDSNGDNVVDLDIAVDIDITINEVNDATVLDVPKVDGVTVGQVVGYEDVPLKINDYLVNGLGTSGLQVIDPDDLDAYYVIEFELSRNWGKLSFGDADVNGVLDGVWTSEGNGKYTFKADSLDDIHRVLDTLTYESPAEAYGNETLKISVYDNEERTAVNDRSDAVTIDIKITEVNDDPVFKNEDPDDFPDNFLSMDKVKEGDLEKFLPDMFNITDVDNADAHLVITINEAPKHGTIMKDVGGTLVAIAKGESFTYEDVKQGLIYYQHNGGQVRSDGTEADTGFHYRDSFTFSVNDGAGGFLNSDNPAHNGVQVTEGGITKSIHTFAITLAPVNQAPEVAGGDKPDSGELVYQIYEGQEEFPVIFDIADGDQLKANDFIIEIIDASNLDGVLYFNGVPVYSGQRINYTDILEGKLRFSHDGSDGYDNVLGKTQDTSFTFKVIDDGGGAFTDGGDPDIEETVVKLTFNVLSNNDNPYFDNGLVELPDGTVTTGGQVGGGDPEHPDSWLIQMGQGSNKGGFNVSDDDSSAKDITYTIVAGDIWIKTGESSEGVGRYIQLKPGDSFTQQQINAGVVYFHTTERNAVTETSIQVTVRDGSLTTWAKVVDENGIDVREGGELVVQNGIEGGVGSFVDVDGEGNYEWKLTVITIPVKYYVETGGSSVIEIVPDLYLGSAGDGTIDVYEGKQTSLKDVLDSYYLYKNDQNQEVRAVLSEDDAKELLYRIEDKLSCGSLWLVDELGRPLRQLNQYDTFSQWDLDKGRVVYEHDGSKTFSDTIKLTLTDGSINLMDPDSTNTIKTLTVGIDVTPGNDTPETETKVLEVLEGAEKHQDGETGFDRNGSLITGDHIVITDPDGSGDASKPGQDYTSTDDQITIIFQKPGYGDIWVWVYVDGTTMPDNTLLDGDREMSLDDYNDSEGSLTTGYWHKLTAAEYAEAGYANAGTALSVSYAQLKNGCVRYVHDGRDPSFEAGDTDYRGGSFSDVLHFRVDDGKGFATDMDPDDPESYHHKSWTEDKLNIKISNVNDKPRNMVDEDDAEPFHTPENGNRNPEYYEGNPKDVNDSLVGTLITNEFLHYVDAEKGAASLQYYIDKAPVNGTLYLKVGSDWVAIGEGAKFTQDDIDNNRVKYVHSGTETHTDSFAWTLRDGDENKAKWVANEVFDIVVDPTNNKPEIDVKPNEAKQDATDKYVYITPPDASGGKDLGGVFQVRDRDYQGDGLGVPAGNDEILATLKSTIAKDDGSGKYTQGDVDTGSLFISLKDLTSEQITRLGNLEISVDGGNTFVSISSFLNGESAGAAEIMLKGGLDEVNAALELLHYRPASNCENQTANIRLEVDDLGNGDVDGNYNQHAVAEIAEMQMYVNIVNEPPVLSGLPAADSLVMKEDGGSIQIKNAADWLKFTDPDPMPDWARNELTLTVEYGSLAFGSSTAAISSKPVGNTRVYTITGSLAEINAALTGLTYTPNQDYNGTAEVSLHFQDNISDEGIIDDAFTIKVTPVNDQPTLDGTTDIIVIGGVGVTNEVGKDLAIAISDKKDTSGPPMNNTDNSARDNDMTVTLTLERDVAESGSTGGNGKLVLADKYGVTVTQSVDNILVLTGKEDAIVQLLQELQIEMNENEGVYKLNVEVNDNQNGGSEGATGIVDKNFTFIVGSGDTKPQTSTGGNRTTDEDASVENLGIVVDSKCVGGADIMQVTVEVVDYVNQANTGTGTLTLDPAGLLGSAVITGSGTKTIVITGSETDVNEALAQLVYKPGTHDNAVDNQGDPSGADKVKVSVVDRPGYPGAGDNLVGDPVFIDIAIRPVNDAPVAKPGAVDMGSVDEDIADASNTGKTVTELFTPKFDDTKDTQAGGSGANNLAGVIVTANGAISDQGKWQYQDPISGQWKDISVGMYLGAKVSIRFEPALDYNGTVGQLSVRLVDDSAQESHNLQHDAVPGTGESGIYQNDLGYYIKEGYVYTPPTGTAASNDNTSRYSNGTVNLKVTVKAVNDAPVVTGSNPVTVDAYEDTAGSGKTVGELIPAADYFSDPKDAGKTNGADALAGVVVSVVENNGHGTWQYSVDGVSWSDITASGTDGVYLTLGTYIRFNPTVTAGGVEHFNGDPGASLTVHLVETDGGSGKTADAPADTNTYTTGQTISFAVTGGSARISDGTVTLNAAIHAINDAPVVDKTHNPSATVTLPTINEDANKDTNPGYTVENLFNAGGTSPNALFTDPRDNVGGIGGSVSDGFAGILVVGNTADKDTQGEWQYFDKTSNSWKDINTLLAGGNYAYLTADAQIRFQPAAEFNGAAPDLVVRLVDNSSDYGVNPDNPLLPTLAANVTYATIAGAGFKSGGTTRYSADTVKVTVSVNPINDAPVVDGSANNVTVAEDTKDNNGVSVDSVFGGTFNDSKDAQTGNGGQSVSNSFAGVIVKGVTNGSHGVWEYESAPGVWTPIATPPAGEGLFLEAGTNIRFSPKDSDGNPDHFNGDPLASLEVHLVETAADNSAFATSGTLVSIAAGDIGDTSRVSAGTVSTKATITPVNDAPVVNDSGPAVITVDEDRTGDAHTIGGPGGLFTDYFTDSNDAGRGANDGSEHDSMAGVVVIAVNDSQGTWQYWNGSGWESIAAKLTANNGKGLFLDNDAQVRFVPTTQHYNGDPNSTITVRLVETDVNADSPDTQNYASGTMVNIGLGYFGGSTRISDGTIALKVTVNAVNDAPVDKLTGQNKPVPLPGVLEDTPNGNPGHTISDLFSKGDGSQNDRFSNPNDIVPGGSNANGFAGIVVVGNTADKLTEGEWQYQDEGGQWRDIGDLLAGGNYAYLSANASIRFQPVENYNGTPPVLEVRLADNSDTAANNPDNPALPSLTGGKQYATIASAGFAYGGTTRYGSDVLEVTVTVTARNDAPVVDGSANPVIVAEDAKNNAGQTVESVFGDAFSDPADASKTDGGLSSTGSNSFAGVIIKDAVNGSHGQWEYEASPGTWVSIKDALASAGAEEGLFLTADTNIRFSPRDSSGNADHFNGDPGASIEAYLVESKTDVSDTTFTANGPASIADADRDGTTRASKDSVTASATITPVNDSPTRDGVEKIVPIVDWSAVDNFGGTVGGIFSYKFLDTKDNQHDLTDNPNGSKSNSFDGIIITGVNPDSTGVWQYWDPALNGGEWVDTPSLPTATASIWKPTRRSASTRTRPPTTTTRVMPSAP